MLFSATNCNACVDVKSVMFVFRLFVACGIGVSGVCGVVGVTV